MKNEVEREKRGKCGGTVCRWLLPVSVAAVLNVHDGFSIDRCSEMIVEGMPMANYKYKENDMGYNSIPVWRRYTLTIEEAAGYFHIGEGKLRMLIDQNPHGDFYVMNGNRALIKRVKFEHYLDQATVV